MIHRSFFVHERNYVHAAPPPYGRPADKSVIGLPADPRPCRNPCYGSASANAGLCGRLPDPPGQGHHHCH